jgi:hypothetical protein
MQNSLRIEIAVCNRETCEHEFFGDPQRGDRSLTTQEKEEALLGTMIV